MRQDELQKFTEEMQAYVAENLPLDQLDDEQLENRIEDLVMEGLAGRRATIDQRVEIVRSVYSSVRGFDILDAVMQDDSVTQIIINNPHSVFIERDGSVSKLDRQFDDPERLGQIIRRMIGMGGGSVDGADAVAHVRLPDGTCVSAVLPPVAADGPAALIRKARKSPLTVQQMIRDGFLSEEAAENIQALVRAGYNILICGGAGVGKTALLQVLTGMIPSEERVVAIEETAQAFPPASGNVIRLEANGDYTVGALIRDSMRLCPDRIMVDGFCGADAPALLDVLNAGCCGSIAACRAASVDGMLCSMETAVSAKEAGLSAATARRQIAAAVEIVIFVSGMPGRIGRVSEITEVVGVQNGELLLNPLYIFQAQADSAPGAPSGSLERTSEPLRRDRKWRQSGLTQAF